MNPGGRVRGFAMRSGRLRKPETGESQAGRPPRAGRLAVVASALMSAGLLVALPTRAGETQWWIVDSAPEYAKAESRGVVIQPDGTLQLGPRSIFVPADSLNTIWSAAVLSDGSVALAGERGRVDRWTESGGIRPWVRLPVGQVLSVAPDGDGIVAGTGPEGLIYRIGARGDTALLASTGERYVWGLAPASRSAWYAATGTKGKLLRVEGGKTRVILDTDESNLVSLVPDGAGGAFAGGDSKGRVIHVRADGSARTLFDAPEDEVRALAVGSDGALYAAALSAAAVKEEGPGGEESPAPVRGPVTAGKAVVYRIVPDSAAASYWTSPQPFVYGLASSPHGILAVTGNRAAVYRLVEANAASQWLAAPQGQFTAIAVDRTGQVFAATSNPGALWRLGPGTAERGELLSSVLDAGRIARFGRIRWRGEAHGGRVEINTRSGNTDTPDTTWSAWEGGRTEDDGFKIPSAPARCLQWRLTLTGGSPRIESVEVAWREQNLAPRVEEVVVAPQGQGFREGDLLPRSESVTQTMPGGQKVEYSISPSTAPRVLRDLPMWARGIRTVQWKASDPNGDALLYRAEARAESDGRWIEIGKDLNATAFSWDTNALPDGRYRLRVTASDERVNPVGEERTAEALSEPFTVDNSPPIVSEFEAGGERGGIRIRARAEDGMSPLSRLEISVDDDHWRTVSPEGGLADDRRLSVHALIPGVKPGEHTISLRAVDLAGNTATRAAQVTVPGAR